MRSPDAPNPVPPIRWRCHHSLEGLSLEDAPPALPLWAVGATLTGFYLHGIAYRIETHHDLGFTWVWVRMDQSSPPRILLDDLLNGADVIESTGSSSDAFSSSNSVHPDWFERGTQPTLEAAVAALGSAVAAQHPNSEFAAWWSEFMQSVSKPGDDDVTL
jgi:hypothetical protein